MGIEIRDALAVLPQGAEDVVRETTIYVEGDRIAGVGEKPSAFTADKVISGKDKLVIPGADQLSHPFLYVLYAKCGG